MYDEGCKNYLQKKWWSRRMERRTGMGREEEGVKQKCYLFGGGKRKTWTLTLNPFGERGYPFSLNRIRDVSTIREVTPRCQNWMSRHRGWIFDREYLDTDLTCQSIYFQSDVSEQQDKSCRCRRVLAVAVRTDPQTQPFKSLLKYMIIPANVSGESSYTSHSAKWWDENCSLVLAPALSCKVLCLLYPSVFEFH